MLSTAEQKCFRHGAHLNARVLARLARKKKAESNVDKDAIQIAQELLVKKLSTDKTVPQQTENDIDLYAQHFERPINKHKDGGPPASD